MTRLRKLLQLAPSDRALVIRATILVAAFRLALWVLPYRHLRRFLSPHRGARPALRIPANTPVERLAWAVRAVSRPIPSATCLTQSLALHYLMTRAGHASSMHIGVAKDSESGFHAHAWVEHNGAPLLNSPLEVAHYSRLLSVEAAIE